MLQAAADGEFERALESMVLALAHCYHFRLLEDVAHGSRHEYREQVTALALACPVVQADRELCARPRKPDRPRAAEAPQ